LVVVSSLPYVPAALTGTFAMTVVPFERVTLPEIL
jgi:hypothetical protein